ncbi:MAG: transporter [Thiohalomonadales bacterium]
MKRIFWPLFATSLGIGLITQPAFAHDPVFGIGPHVLFKDGIEAAVTVAQDKASAEKKSGLQMEIVYGITGDWAAGIDVPFVSKENSQFSSSGISDIQAFTKYRFWREDSLGLQESAAVLLAVNADNGDVDAKPKLGNGATDIITGLTYGYESIKSYRWASARYILPGESDAGFQFGNKWLIDFVVGWRPTPPEYKKPDTVWLLELNSEFADKATFNGNNVTDSGGSEWFISPGIFWTTRNFAIKSGIQIPISSSLNGTQNESDYRFKATFEWHL